MPCRLQTNQQVLTFTMHALVYTSEVMESSVESSAA
jgi:hypothetical protein